MVDHNADATLTATAYFPVAQYGDHQDWPNNKIAYDSDGTLIIFTQWSTYNGTGSQTVPRQNKTADSWRILNSYEPILLINDNYNWDEYTYYFMFPEPRTITHVFGAHDGGLNATFTFYASTDTTTGWDGTWTNIGSMNYPGPWWYSYSSERKRPLPVTSVVTGAVAVKAQIYSALSLGPSGGYHHKVHLYGDKSQDGDRLALWHPTRDEELDQKYLDWGSFQYGTDTRQFRVKNMSPTKRAINNRINLNTDSASWGTRFTDLHTLEYGGVEGQTVDIPNLQSKEITDVITLTRNIPPAQINARWFDVKITATQTWVTYIHNVAVNLSAETSLASDRYTAQLTTAPLSARADITDGTLYYNSGVYRDSKSYRGSRTTQIHAASATLTVSAAGDLFVDDYRDAYGNAGIEAAAYNLVQKTTAALAASAVGDNYSDLYTDEYGNTGLSASATIT